MFNNNDLDPVVSFFAFCLAMLPLAIWKVIDIAIWLFKHVSISIGG